MRCPLCGSDSYEILKTKGKVSKELLLKCKECKTIYKEVITGKKPVDRRIIISEYETSKKMHIKLHPDDLIEVDDVLNLDDNEVAVTSIETKSGGRVMKSPVSEIETIWACSLDIPARVGISIDFGGKVLSKKIEIDRDFEFEVGDIIKIGKFSLKVYSIKTTTQKLRKGSSKASITKRVYGMPLSHDKAFNYDLSSKVI